MNRANSFYPTRGDRPAPARPHTAPTEVIRADLQALASELQSEVDQLLANVSAQESASMSLETQFLELSDALQLAQRGRTPRHGK